MAAQGTGGIPQFSPQETAFYQQLFNAADPSGTGIIQAQQAVDLLRRSGQSRSTLGKVWDIADASRQGFLARDGFFVALRLVAHAQAGAAVTPELAWSEPRRLPSLEGFAEQPPASATRELSIGWQTEVSLSSVGSGVVRPPSWAPSEREKRKYASLFLRTDTNGDGFVEADEARALCQCSRLDESELARAWMFADQDRDGRLNFPEFVALVHTVTCSTRGLPVPQMAEGPHPQLSQSVAEISSSPEQLHGQRSRSVSRATSVASSRSVSPAPSRAGRGATPPGSSGAGADARERPPHFSGKESAFYQQIFDTIDPGGAGIVRGQEVVDLLGRSGLSHAALGKIWDIADAKKQGAFSRDDFFLALRLVAHAQAGSTVSLDVGYLEPPQFPSLEGFAGQAPPSTNWLKSEASLSSTASSVQRLPSFTPSQREKRKYASLFLRTDTDSDGYVQADEARALCKQSGLDDSELARAWTHADQDRDGRLSFPEFIALIHTVTCSTRGMPIPSLAEGLHPELARSIADINAPPEQLHAQRSRSASRATSAASSRAVSPAPNRPSDAAAPDAHQERPYIDTADATLSLPPRSDPASPPSQMSSPCFGNEPSGADLHTGPLDVHTVRRHLSGVLEADRLARAHVEHETILLQERVREARASCEKLKPHVMRERDETRRLTDMSGQLERQLSDARQRLLVLHEKRRALRLRNPLGDAAEDVCTFLSRIMEDDSRLTEDLHRSNSYLNKSISALAGEMADISAMRAPVMEQLSRSQALLSRDRLRHAELRSIMSGDDDAKDFPTSIPPTPCSRQSGAPGWASTLVRPATDARAPSTRARPPPSVPRSHAGV